MLPLGQSKVGDTLMLVHDKQTRFYEVVEVGDDGRTLVLVDRGRRAPSAWPERVAFHWSRYGFRSKQLGKATLEAAWADA